MNGNTNANGGTLIINGGADGIIINGNTSSNTTYVPCITINNGGTCTLTNVTIQNNKAGYGGAIQNSGTLTATSCIFQNNIATNAGGAIFSSYSATLSSCTITDNSANEGGAGIYASEALSCTSCTLSNNSISDSNMSGGGIYYCGSANTTNKLTIDGCTINGNSAGYRGGGIIMHVNGTTYCNGEIKGATNIYGNSAKDAGGLALHASNVTCTLSAGTIYGNSASRNGGGIHISPGSTLTYSGGDIGKTGSGNENTATSDGGGIYVQGSLLMNAGNILNNSANQGGGVFVTSTGSMTFTTGSIHDNTATTNGGGIYFDGTTFTIGGSTVRSIYSNSAANGGGVYVGSNGTFAASNAKLEIHSNSATNGGGIYSAGALTLSNTNIGKSGYPNTATNGGGLYVNSSQTNMTAGSIYYNTASQDGGGVYVNGGTLTVAASREIVYNTATRNGGGVYVASNGTFNSNGLVGKSGGANTAERGGGVYTAGTLNILAGNIQYNTMTGTAKLGAGVFIAGGTTTMSGGSINNNTSAIDGGGVYMNGGSFSITTGGTITTNSATQDGGGVYVNGGTFTVSASREIIKNTATRNGGGVYVASSGTFNSNGIVGKSNNANTAERGAGVYTAGELNIQGGNIQYNTMTGTAKLGAGVYIAGGTTTMSGGSINNNTTDIDGGGVYIASGATFTMNTGATISANTAKGATAIGDGGGGVYNAGTFTMNGGEIFSNTANNGANTSGGGVSTSGTFNMFGGTIGKSGSPNRSRYGGGVCVAGGTFTLDGGDIVFNEASNGASSPTWYSGGGVYVAANATFTLTSGNVGKVVGTTANLNKALEGGGVYVAGTFNCNGGNVQYNTATSNGGGIYLAASGTLNFTDGFSMSAGTIRNNTASAFGGGVYIPAGVTYGMSGGEIYSNTATTSGGGVYVVGTDANTKGVFNMTGGTIGKDDSSKAYLFNKAATGAGVYVAAYGEFTMQNAEILGNTATSSGGGVYVIANGTFTMDNSTIHHNTTSLHGGGIFTSGSVTATNTNGICKIYNNTATNSSNTRNGGGVYIEEKGSFSMTGGEIYNNTARNNGGGIYVTTKATSSCTLTNCDVYGNTSTHGAGVYKEANAVLSITGGKFYSNAATTNGGGIYISGGTGASAATLSGVSIGKTDGRATYPNTAKVGGGIYMATGTVTIQKNTTTDAKSYIIANNTTITGGTTGGGIHMAAGTLDISDTEITGNTSNTTGGGIHMGAGTMTITDTEISDNTATTTGGGIHMVGGTLNITDTEILNNTATTTGGGIHHGNGTINIIDCQITGNSAATNGGGIYKNGNNSSATNIYVSGVVVINNNLTGSAANNLYINNLATRFIYIAEAGLECGSCIGITSAVGYSSNTKKIVQGDGADAIDNCAYAYRNRFFFSDNGADGVFNNNASPYYSGSTNSLYFVANATYQGVMDSWLTSANASGCTLDGNGFVTAVNNAAGMAYFAQHILAGNDYSGKTVSLTANIDLSGHNWEPIGYAAECLEGNGTIFNGTFDGQGHTIANITSPFPYDNMGLFGVVGDDGVVKNTVVANIKFSGSNTHTGAVAGLLNGTAYNCSAITLRSGSITTDASLVGELGAGGSLMNCFVNTSATNGLADVNGGTIANCYMRGATDFVGSGSTGTVDYCYAPSGSVSGTNSVYGATALVDGKYGFAHSDQQITANSDNSYITNGAIDNRGELKGLLATLNNWVRASGNGWNAGTQSNNNGYALWTRTMASPINGDYPVLMMPGTVCVGSPDGTLLDYASNVNTLMTSYTTSGDIYLYATNPTALGGTNGTTRVYINEHVGVLQTAGTTVNARVGVTLDNSSSGYMSYDWHMFSSALTAAPMGLEYHSGVNDTYYVKDNYSSLLSGGIPHSIYTSEANMDPTQTTWNTANIGYFPTDTPYGKWRGTDDPNGCFDFYCYAEPYCHWINFKREGVTSFYDHWHQDADDNDKHLNIPYENELTMTQGKGYLVDLSAPSMLMADGVLNNGDASGNVSVNVTASDINFTGYEYALKGVNLIGNPYQSYLDFSEFNTTNSINTYFILDADQHGYVSYTVGQSAPVAPQYLHPHQGFFVRVSNSGSLQFTPSMRATTGGNFRSDTPHYPLVNLVCTDSQGRNDFATVELDRPEAGGGEKVSGLHAGDASVWIHLDDLEWQTAFTTPGIHEVPVRFRAYNDGMFTLGWETKNSNFSYMHLIDNLTGMDIDCLNASEYHFEGKTTDYWSRFRLVFEYTDVEENEEDGPSTGSGTFAFFMGDELVVNGPSTDSGASAALLQLFDINGRCVFSTELYDTQSVVSPPKVAPGIYILRLTGNQVTRTQKMVINK